MSATMLASRDLKVIENDEPRILDLRLGERLQFERPRTIRQLIERNRAELERYGQLICCTMQQIGPGRPADECWLNEAQALLICMKSETAVAADIREEIIRVFLDWRRCNMSPEATAITNAIVQPMLKGFEEMMRRFDQVNALLLGKRKEISDAVKREHIWMCHRLGGRCACCGISRVTNPDGTKAPFAEFDHMQHKSAPTVDDTWLICSGCHRKLTFGEMLRNECAQAFDLYQARRVANLSAAKAPSLVPICEIESGPPSSKMTKQGTLFE